MIKNNFRAIIWALAVASGSVAAQVPFAMEPNLKIEVVGGNGDSRMLEFKLVPHRVQEVCLGRVKAYPDDVHVTKEGIAVKSYCEGLRGTVTVSGVMLEATSFDFEIEELTESVPTDSGTADTKFVKRFQGSLSVNYREKAFIGELGLSGDDNLKIYATANR